jgi:hypothetical protein
MKPAAPSVPPRASWTSVALLGLFILALFDVAVPFGLEWWADDNARLSRHLGTAQAMNAAFENVLALHAILPLRVIGAIAAIVCWIIAASRYAAQRRRPRHK